VQNVRFLGSRNDVPRLLAAMDVFALTSHIEANPVSILEAMSAGRPVVATNVGSIHEAVTNGGTGFLVEPGDADQLAGRIIGLLQDASLRRSMGESARQAVLARWSLDAMVHGYERLIESVYDQKVFNDHSRPQLPKKHPSADNQRTTVD
jgi:glycosyltransferase involved in cell wall biosynthesis